MRRVLWAIRLRCPNCGHRGVVRGLRVTETCPACRHHFERHEGYWLGAIAINTIITLGLFVAAMVIPILATWPDPPWGVITALLVSLSIVVPIVAYPFSKTLWVALELGMHPAEGP
jgi:uncharacterized protein (DUF983 family)